MWVLHMEKGLFPDGILKLLPAADCRSGVGKVSG